MLYRISGVAIFRRFFCTDPVTRSAQDIASTDASITPGRAQVGQPNIFPDDGRGDTVFLESARGSTFPPFSTQWRYSRLPSDFEQFNSEPLEEATCALKAKEEKSIDGFPNIDITVRASCGAVLLDGGKREAVADWLSGGGINSHLSIYPYVFRDMFLGGGQDFGPTEMLHI